MNAMPPDRFIAFDRLDLPATKRAVLLRIARCGQATVAEQGAGHEPADVRSADATEGRRGRLPPAFPSPLDVAIERQGRMPVRGRRINGPHAVAARLDGEAGGTLAIARRREDDAPPIRLLYPDDIAPMPHGNAHAQRVRIDVGFTPVLVGMVIDACNRA